MAISNVFVRIVHVFFPSNITSIFRWSHWRSALYAVASSSNLTFSVFFFIIFIILFSFLKKKYLVHGIIKSWFMNYLNKNTNGYILFMYYIYVLFAECLRCHIEWQHSYFCLSTKSYFCSIQHLKKTFFVKN